MNYILVSDTKYRKAFDITNLLSQEFPQNPILLGVESVSFFKKLHYRLSYGNKKVVLLRSSDQELFETDLDNLCKEYNNDTELTLTKFLEIKRKDFFKEEGNSIINRNDNPWSHRKLLILYDILSKNSIWDDSHENIVFRINEDAKSKDEIFIGQDTIWKAERYYDPNAKVCLKDNWREILIENYKVKIDE
jgi:hypothetical protein